MYINAKIAELASKHIIESLISALDYLVLINIFFLTKNIIFMADIKINVVIKWKQKIIKN